MTKIKANMFSFLRLWVIWIENLPSLFPCRHMLNVTWEHNDFSFNSNGYLVNPAMIVITLDRERQWDKVSLYYCCGLVILYQTVRENPGTICSYSFTWWRLSPHAHCRVISYFTGLFIKTVVWSQSSTDTDKPLNKGSSSNHTRTHTVRLHTLLLLPSVSSKDIKTKPTHPFHQLTLLQRDASAARSEIGGKPSRLKEVHFLLWFIRGCLRS